MCQQTYVGCEYCEADTENIFWFQSQEIHETATLTNEGEIAEFRGDTEYEDPHDSGYACESCGLKSSTLNEECVPDECSCAECQEEHESEDNEPESQPSDAEAIWLLRRTNHITQPVTARSGPSPIEVRELYKDRATSVIAIRASRGGELFRSGALDAFALQVDSTTPVPEHLKKQLLQREKEAA